MTEGVAAPMSFGQIAFAIGMIASGTLNIVNRDFYAAWVPAWVPTHGWPAYLCGALMVLGGIGLLIKRTAAQSARVLFGFTLLWLVLMNTPRLVTAPQIELNWLAWGQIAVLVTGALTLAATNERQLRAARYLLGVALVPIGLSHFFYLPIATGMVPPVLPFRPAWVIFTGIAHIAAGVAVLIGVYARLATILEASMITGFMVLVWGIPVVAKPGDVSLWVRVVITLAVAGGVWAVASKMRLPATADAVLR